MRRIYTDNEMDIITLHNMNRILSKHYGEISFVQNSIKCYRYNENNEKIYFGNTPQYFRYNAVIERRVDISSIYSKAPRMQDQGQIIAAGASTYDENKAKIRAMGEAFERLCFLENTNIKSYYKSYNELRLDNFKIIHPRDLIFFSDEQYENPNFIFEKYDNDDRIYWCEGEKINSNEKYMIPLTKVVYKKSQKHLDYAISTGNACGSCKEQAILNGIYEVIERDNFMLMWNLKLGCKEIVLDKIRNEELKRAIDSIKIYMTGEDKLKFFNISLFENIYTMMAVIVNDLESSPGIIVSTSTHLDPEKAILGCINEMHLTYNYANTYMKKDYSKKYLDMTKYDINELRDHIKYYFSNKNNKNIDFFFYNSSKQNISTLKNNSKLNYNDDIDICVLTLKKNNYDIFYIDCTTDVIKQAGLWVIRIIIPHLLDLEVSHNVRHTYGQRMDYYRRKYNIKEINPEPHPFP